MNPKVLLYVFVTLIVIIGLDSVNLNGIFKNNKYWQARIFYFLLILALVYLITNLIYDFGTLKIFLLKKF